jgi:hypothetical protein
VRAETLGDQRHADHDEEAQRQHHDARIAVDETRERLRGEQHRAHCGDHRDEHDRNMVGHADRGHDAVDREHQVEHQDLADRRPHRQAACAGRRSRFVVVARHVMVDLARRLPDEEQAAGQQDRVAPRERMIEQREHGLGQARDPCDGAEQREPHHQRETDAEPLRAGALRFRQLVAEDRDEDQVVDAEHDFHHDERQERRPDGGVGGECKQVVHQGSGTGIESAMIARHGLRKNQRKSDSLFGFFEASKPCSTFAISTISGSS